MNQQLKAEIIKMKNGDFSGYEIFNNLTTQFIYKMITDVVANGTVANQMFANIYDVIYRQISSLDSPDNFFEWVAKIVTVQTLGTILEERTGVMDFGGHEEYTLGYEFAKEDEEKIITEAIYNNADIQKKLMLDIDKLSSISKLVMQCFYFENMSIDDIADMTALSRNAVQNAITEVKNCVKKYTEESKLDSANKQLLSFAEMPILFLLFQKNTGVISTDEIQAMIPLTVAASATASAVTPFVQGVAGRVGMQIPVSAGGTIEPTVPIGASHMQPANPIGASHMQPANPIGASHMQPANPIGAGHIQPANPIGAAGGGNPYGMPNANPGYGQMGAYGQTASNAGMSTAAGTAGTIGTTGTAVSAAATTTGMSIAAKVAIGVAICAALGGGGVGIYALANKDKDKDKNTTEVITELQDTEQSVENTTEKPQETSTEATTEATTEEQTPLEIINSYRDDTANWTEDDWVALAEERKLQGYQLYLNPDGDYETDMYDQVELNVTGKDGKPTTAIYWRVIGTNSKEEASKQFREVFYMEMYQAHLDWSLVEYNGGVYSNCFGVGDDMTLLDSYVDSLTNIDTEKNELTFDLVEVHIKDDYLGQYYIGMDGIPEEAKDYIHKKYTLNFEDGIWKLGEDSLLIW